MRARIPYFLAALSFGPYLSPVSDIPIALAAALAGRYTIERELGRGGNAVVYLAHDPKHDRRVALKVLLPELAQSVRSERFLREIQIAAKLTHPHILPLHDSGVAEGIFYYVMPYVEGESLRDRLRREQQLSLVDAIQVAREVASALAYAHEQGVLHRDIKPENILLQRGVAVVADFGIARALTEASGQTVTQTGIAVGTPVYMSPEQGGGSKTLDGRSDVYSLGCVVYEMLAGRPPFVGETPQEILAHHALDPVPRLRKLRPEVPIAVEQAITDALAKRPGERVVSAAAFADALAAGSVARRSVFPSFRPSRHLLYAWLGLALLLGVYATAARTPLLRRAAVAAPEQSLAVLPFVNMSGDTANEYLSDGMTEELINALVQISGLRVPARTSAFVFKGHTADIREIGRKLNVARLVEGSVQRAGMRLRVTAQLINVADGYHVWSESYDRELHDVFKVQDELVRAIAGAVQVKLAAGRAPVRHSTENEQAYDAYLRGRYFWYQRSPDGFRKAISYFEEAIALDSGYALAYSGLADTYMLSGEFGYLPRREGWPRAKVAALTAVARDSGLAEAYVSLGRVHEEYDWDWAGAEQAFRRAIALNPRYALAHSWYGLFLASVLSVKGRADEGIRETGLAVALDPLNGAFNANHALALFAIGRRGAEAIAYGRKAVELLPGWAAAHMVLGLAYLAESRYGEAAAEFERARHLGPGVPAYAAFLGHAYARMGRRAAALQLLGEVQRRPDVAGFAGALATLYLGLGEHERALTALETAVERHDFFKEPQFGGRLWDPLRADPRFARILVKAGLGP